MKFAAKRIWPDRPKTWERQGEGESLESFALAFASDAGLGLGSELMVIQKDADDPAIELFRVTAIDPYALGPAQARPADGASPAAPIGPQPAPDNAQPEVPPANPADYEVSFRPVIGVVWSLGRVALIIGGTVTVLMLAIKYAREYL